MLVSSLLHACSHPRYDRTDLKITQELMSSSKAELDGLHPLDAQFKNLGLQKLVRHLSSPLFASSVAHHSAPTGAHLAHYCRIHRPVQAASIHQRSNAHVGPRTDRLLQDRTRR